MTPLPRSLDRFGDELDRAAHRELGSDPEPTRPRLLRRPRVLAGGTLGLAGIGAALVVALGTGGATAPPAFAVTTNSDGTVVVHVADLSGLGGAEHELASMGINEWVLPEFEPGSQVSSPVTCTPAPGGSGPTVQLVLDDGTVGQHVVLESNGTPGTGLHMQLAGCTMRAGAYTGYGNSGPSNTGPGNSGPGNSGPRNTGPGNTGPGNSGPGNTGN